MHIYNTLTRKKEKFKPINPPKVGLYCCGPTVYDYQHIGNMRTYIFEDILKRTLEYNGYKVKHIMNITDIGHLVSDADEGEDKMMKALKREKLPVTKEAMLELAHKYTETFKNDLHSLNIKDPSEYTPATEHIPEQIRMVQTLIDKGFTYETTDGIYFDTTKYPGYGKLALLDKQKLQAGKRINLGEKKDIHDFALWKFSQPNENRIMEWKAFGKMGFPGWHIECSAMSTKYLGKHFDIHCGGIDHIPVHHTDERAQNNCAYGLEESVNYWMHGEFLVLDKGKMSKSAGTFITLKDAMNKGISPLAYRYFCLMTHYRKPLSFSWEALKSAQNGLNKLYSQINNITHGLEIKGSVNKEFQKKFQKCINNDLNSPKALALIFEVLNSKINDNDKFLTIINFDKVLGLDLKQSVKKHIDDFINPIIIKRHTGFQARARIISKKINTDVNEMAEKRFLARQNKNWKKSDELKTEIHKLGYIIRDNKDGYELLANREKVLFENGFKEDFSRDIYVNKNSRTVVSLEYLNYIPEQDIINKMSDILKENNTNKIKWFFTKKISEKNKKEISKEYNLNNE